MIDDGSALVAAVVVAAGLEAVIGEPPESVHPVALLGNVLEWLDSKRFGVPKLAGTVYALAVPIGCGLLAYGIVWVAESTAIPLFGALAAAVVLWVSSSLRMLFESARRVVELSDEDTLAAREALSTLAGRDPELPAALLRSAAIESLAENLSDGFIAPLSAFVIFSFVSIPAAAAGAAAVKGVNTMDSMFGYPGSFGWASARLDDLVMFVPARLSAILLGLGGGDPDAPFRARRYARKPASPNSGWPMGTLAAALNVRLEKPGVYVLNDVANYPTVANGRDAIASTRRAATIAYGVAVVVGVIRWL